MITSVAKCREGLKSRFNKLIGIVDPEHAPDFLEEVNIHYATNTKSKMLQEKLYHVVSSQVITNEKVRWLKIWNGQ